MKRLGWSLIFPALLGVLWFSLWAPPPERAHAQTPRIEIAERVQSCTLAIPDATSAWSLRDDGLCWCPTTQKVVVWYEIINLDRKNAIGLRDFSTTSDSIPIGSDGSGWSQYGSYKLVRPPQANDGDLWFDTTCSGTEYSCGDAEALIRLGCAKGFEW